MINMVAVGTRIWIMSAICMEKVGIEEEGILAGPHKACVIK
jgi:hypothetical protein